MCRSILNTISFHKIPSVGIPIKTKRKLSCENGFWELRLGILGAISSWLPLITFTKFVELRFTVLISLDVLIDIKFCFKCRKETLWFHLEHLLYEILTLDIDFSNTFSKFSVVEIWSVYFYPEETITEFSNSFSLTKYYP